MAFVYSNRRLGTGEGGNSEPPVDFNITEDTTGPEIVDVDEGPDVKPQPEPSPVKIIPEPTADASPKVDAVIAEAMGDITAKPGRIIEARDKLNDALSMPMSHHQRAIVKGQLCRLSEQWLFSGSVFAEDGLCESYRVNSGEDLWSIGKEYKVPHEILVAINNIRRPESLPAGQTIKVVKGPFHARIYRSSFTMDLYLQNNYVCSFAVGLGQPGKETPTGLWRVKSDGKMIEPPWPDPVTGKILHKGDPGYALGSRWIGLEGLKGNAEGRTGFGIHGTKDPETIGKKSSRGCVRLHNGDVIRVYNMLVPLHSLVEVEE
jgi:hypothetical protein